MIFLIYVIIVILLIIQIVTIKKIIVQTKKTATISCGFFLFIYKIDHFNLANAVLILSTASTNFSSLAAVLMRMQSGAPKALPVTTAT